MIDPFTMTATEQVPQGQASAFCLACIERAFCSGAYTEQEIQDQLISAAATEATGVTLNPHLNTRFEIDQFYTASAAVHPLVRNVVMNVRNWQHNSHIIRAERYGQLRLRTLEAIDLLHETIGSISYQIHDFPYDQMVDDAMQEELIA